MGRVFQAALAAALLSASFAAAPAFAGEETAEMTVWIGDLNTATAAGSAAALGRIRGEARAFCGGSDGPVSITTRISIRRCRERMTTLAVTKLDAPMVTTLYAASARSR